MEETPAVQEVLRIVKERLSLTPTHSEPLSRLATEVGSDVLKEHYGARPWAKFVEDHKSEISMNGANICLVVQTNRKKKRRPKKKRQPAQEPGAPSCSPIQQVVSETDVIPATQDSPKEMTTQIPGSKIDAVPAKDKERSKEAEEEVDSRSVSEPGTPIPPVEIESSKVDPTSHKNWLVMCNYLQIAVKQIGLCFSRRWDNLKLGSWSNTKSPEVLCDKFPNLLKKFMKDQRAIFLAGDLEKWDISIFFVLFCELDWGLIEDAKESQIIRKIKEIRNIVMHGTFIQEKEFEVLKYSLKDLLVDLGMPEALFDDVHVCFFQV
jgi:hypothetical protein